VFVPYNDPPFNIRVSWPTSMTSFPWIAFAQDCSWLLVWFRRAQPPVYIGLDYNDIHVDGSIFAPRFLVSAKPRRFLTSRFLVSSKSRPFSWFL